MYTEGSSCGGMAAVTITALISRRLKYIEVYVTTPVQHLVIGACQSSPHLPSLLVIASPARPVSHRLTCPAC